MSYHWTRVLPDDVKKDAVILDCRSIHEKDILLPLIEAWNKAVTDDMHGQDYGTFAYKNAIFAFDGGTTRRGTNCIAVAKWLEEIRYAWLIPQPGTSASIMAGGFENGQWEYYVSEELQNRIWGRDGSSDTTTRLEYFQTYVKIVNTILFLGRIFPESLDEAKVPHDTLEIYTVRINLAYLNGPPTAKEPRFPNTFRKELEVLRRLQINKQTSILAGYVYALINPVFEGWVKIGSCVDLGERLAQYQTSDPLRRYAYAFSIFVDDRNEIEELAHSHPELAPARAGDSEWFNVTPTKTQTIIQSLAKIS